MSLIDFDWKEYLFPGLAMAFSLFSLEVAMSNQMGMARILIALFMVLGSGYWLHKVWEDNKLR